MSPVLGISFYTLRKTVRMTATVTATTTQICFITKRNQLKAFSFGFHHAHKSKQVLSKFIRNPIHPHLMGIITISRDKSENSDDARHARSQRIQKKKSTQTPFAQKKHFPESCISKKQTFPNGFIQQFEFPLFRCTLFWLSAEKPHKLNKKLSKSGVNRIKGIPNMMYYIVYNDTFIQTCLNSRPTPLQHPRLPNLS